MAEENKDFSFIESKIESELFALVNTIINLHKRYQESSINEFFFQKAINNATDEMYKIKNLLIENDVILAELLKQMNLLKEYNKAVEIINNISSLNYLKDFEHDKRENTTVRIEKISSLDLPGITSQITCSFITLMDALKLNDFKDNDLIFKLFKELKQNLNKFPGLKEIQIKVKKIYDQITTKPNIPVENIEFREILVNELYQVFKEFQNKLNTNV